MIDLIIWILIGILVAGGIAAMVALYVELWLLRRDLERWDRYREEQGIEPDYSLEDEDV